MKRFLLALALATPFASIAPASAAPVAPLPKAVESYDAASLHFDVYGTANKPALVLLPGLTCGPWEFGNEIARFGSSYTIYALSLPGFDGRAPISGPLVQTVANDFWAWQAARKIERPILLGHSLGGTLATMFATEHADRVRAVIAIDGLPIFPGTESLTAAQRHANADRLASMIAGAPPDKYEAMLETYTMPYMVTSPDDVKTDAALEAKSDPKASAAWMREDLELDLRPDLPKARVPYLLVAPYDSTLDGRYAPTPDAKRGYYLSLVRALPNAQVTVIPQSRHFVMNDQPKALDDAIASFLATLR